MHGNIFINYRREDAADAAGRLYDRLEPEFGAGQLFMDVDRLGAGVDFVDELHREVARCDVFIAVIGPTWTTITDTATGQRRIDAPNDWVRIEIEHALSRGVRVIPVLVNSAPFLQEDELPDDIAGLARRNAVRLTHERFRADVQGLIDQIKVALEEARAQRLSDMHDADRAAAEAVLAREAAAWDAVKGADDPEILKAFLKDWPKSSNAPKARARVRSLQGSGANTRRNVVIGGGIAVAAAAGAFLGLPYLRKKDVGPDAPAPVAKVSSSPRPAAPAIVRTDPVTLGFLAAQTGPYADEGADQLRAFKLAVKHLNGGGDGGMLNTFSSKALKGNGINGRKVQFARGDTQTKSDVARVAAKRLIDKDSAVMISGGSSSGVAIAVQELCQEAGVIFMAGLSVSNDTTGKDRQANGFRHFINSEMTAAALGTALPKVLGSSRKVYHLSADYAWGWSQQEALQKHTEARGWKTVGSTVTPLGAGDFSKYITPVLLSDADVLCLTHYGIDAVNSVTQAVQFGVRDKKIAIVTPFVNELVVRGLGRNMEGVYGAMNWHWSLPDAGSKAFVRSFEREYGFPPSQAAHTCYCQTLLYADACQRAGSFNPCSVAAELSGYVFDGLGNGPTLYRADDHQCLKEVPVVRGKKGATSKFDLLEIIDTVPRSSVEYSADLFGGKLGNCNNGQA